MDKPITVIIAFILLTLGCGGDRPYESGQRLEDEKIPINPGQLDQDSSRVDSLRRYGVIMDAGFMLEPDLPRASVLFMETDGRMDASLRADGFEGPLGALIVADAVRDTVGNVMLEINSQGIFGMGGIRLVDQEPAPFGYAWRIGKTSTKSPLSGRSFISVILLDENGEGVSDELYIYWKSSDDSQGLFVVTNIPNEIM